MRQRNDTRVLLQGKKASVDVYALWILRQVELPDGAQGSVLATQEIWKELSLMFEIGEEIRIKTGPSTDRGLANDNRQGN